MKTHINISIQSSAAKMLFLALVSAALGLSGVAKAQTNVANYSFESPVTANLTYGPPAGWSSSLQFLTSCGVNTYPTAGTNHYNVGTGQGNQALFIQNPGGADNSPGYVYQDVGALLSNTTYTLTVAVAPFAGYETLSLFNELDSTKVPSGTSLASVVYNQNPTNATALVDQTLTFTTGATVSGDLDIALSADFPKTSPLTADFDNVRLTQQAVPEPSAWALGVTSIALFSVLRRRVLRA